MFGISLELLVWFARLAARAAAAARAAMIAGAMESGIPGIAAIGKT